MDRVGARYRRPVDATEVRAAGASPLPDAEARARIRDAHEVTLIVEAAAGTGKTTALVSRLVSMLSAGTARLSRIVAMTFTDKAAGELTLRLRVELDRALGEAQDPTLVARIRGALADLETARVGTIHGFCADILRERPIEARIDPAFTTLAEDEARALAGRALDQYLDGARAAPPEGLRRFLRRPTRFGESVRDVLESVVWTLAQQRDHDTPWRRDPWEREADIDALIARLESLAAYADTNAQHNDPLRKSLAILVGCAADARAREVHGARDYDALEHELFAMAKDTRSHERTGRGKKFGAHERAAVVARRDEVLGELADFAARAGADLAAALRNDLFAVVEGYEALKSGMGRLDFLDQLLCVRDLLRQSASVRAELQARFSHVLVDELQDTDPVQAEIVLLLSADDPDVSDALEVTPVPGKLFVVGDPKQSIYRFRRADISFYARFKERLLARGAQLVHLTSCFRSVPTITEAVNTAFAPLMRGGPVQADYVRLDSLREDPLVDPQTPRPSLVALSVPSPYGYSRPAKKNISESTPAAVGAFVAWLVQESGWRVRDPITRELSAVQPHHVALLFKRTVDWGRDAVRPYLRELEARGVPHVYSGGRSFLDREEVVALRAVVGAIERPDDALCVYATLRGPFLGFSDAALLLFRDECGAPHPLRRFAMEELEGPAAEIAEALALLRELHLARNRRPIADTLGAFLDAVRAHAVLALWQGGPRVLESALRMVELARRFDARGALSFRALSDWLDEQAERPEAERTDVGESGVEEGAEGVRVMTVHRAKGLEFPVVVLCDPTAPGGGYADRYVDSERGIFAAPLAGLVPQELLDHASEVEAACAAETVRLAYVACTRASDLLVIPAVGVGTVESWLSPLEPALYPDKLAWRSSEPAPGCPSFGEESVLARPMDAADDRSVRPGLHRTLSHASVPAGLGPVWWDPSTLALDVRSARGLGGEDVLVPPAEGVVDEGALSLERWQQARQRALEDGALELRPLRRARTIAERVGVATRSEVSEESAWTPPSARPIGRRLGALFTRALPHLSEPPDTLDKIVSAEARSLGASDEEKNAASTALSALRAHHVFSDAAAQRDVPVMARGGASEIIEGRADVVLDRGEAGLVVARAVLRDDVTGEPERRELALVADAIADATGRPVRALLVTC